MNEMRKLMEAVKLDETLGDPMFSVGLTNNKSLWAEVSYMWTAVKVAEMDKYVNELRTQFEVFKKKAAKAGFEVALKDNFQIYVSGGSVTLGAGILLKNYSASKGKFIRQFNLTPLWD